MLNLITKHLDSNGMKLQRCENLKNEVCAFTGLPISEGVKLKDLIKDTFTDQSYIRYPSDFASIEIGMLLEATVPIDKGFNCLRNYSFLATEDSLMLLKREEVLNHLLHPPKEPFYFGVTYSNKKHIAFKCRLNQGKENLIVTTDKGDVAIDYQAIARFLPIIESWYTVPENEKSKSLRIGALYVPKTIFTKSEILGLSKPHFNIIQAYGLDKFEAENQVLQVFRDASLFDLAVWGLNKNYKN